MANGESYAVHVECTYCKTQQIVKAESNLGGGIGVGAQTVSCIKCKKNFEATVPDRIIGGPFAA
jgi:DNA-directed RNA polymerase subunit RPC12/RpoP